MTEVWKDIKGYEGLYQISSYGRVKSLISWNGHKYIKKTKIINGWEQKPNKNGKYSRMKISLRKNKGKNDVMVHRLVAEAFIPNPENKPLINHIDGNPLNNHYTNLEWCTQKENVNHAINTGLYIRKWDLIKRDELVEMLNAGWNYDEIAEHYDVAKGTVFNYIKRLKIKRIYY